MEPEENDAVLAVVYDALAQSEEAARDVIKRLAQPYANTPTGDQLAGIVADKEEMIASWKDVAKVSRERAQEQRKTDPVQEMDATARQILGYMQKARSHGDTGNWSPQQVAGYSSGSISLSQAGTVMQQLADDGFIERIRPAYRYYRLTALGAEFKAE